MKFLLPHLTVTAISADSDVKNISGCHIVYGHDLHHFSFRFLFMINHVFFQGMHKTLSNEISLGANADRVA